MFSFFSRPQSHYEEQVDASSSIQVSTFRSTNQKIVEACANLEDYAREAVPARAFTAAQLAEILEGQRQREYHRTLFDAGFWLPIGQSSSFRIKDV